jgi:hypothetical protein
MLGRTHSLPLPAGRAQLHRNPWPAADVSRGMQRWLAPPRQIARSGRLLSTLVLCAVVIGCQPDPGEPSHQPSPTSSADGPEALIADLLAAGAVARLGAGFTADPLPGQGIVLCVGKEGVQLFVFPSIRDRMDAASRIDPKDPWHIGTSVVEWIGRPRFWQRDRLLVLYLGEDVATDNVLRTVLGPPFASGEGGGSMLRDNSCS